MKRFVLTMGCVAMMVAYLIFEDGSERDNQHSKSLRAQAPIYLSDTNITGWNSSGRTEKDTLNTFRGGRK